MDRLHPLHRQETSSPTTPMKILPTMRYCKSSQNFPAYQVDRICTRCLGVFRLVSLLTLDNLICIIIRVGFVIFLLYYYRVPGYCWLSLCFRSFTACTAASYTLSWYLCTIKIVRLARLVAVSGYFTSEPSSGKVSKLLSDLHVSFCSELSNFPEPIRKVTYLLSHIEMNGAYAMIEEMYLMKFRERLSNP